MRHNTVPIQLPIKHTDSHEPGTAGRVKTQSQKWKTTERYDAYSQYISSKWRWEHIQKQKVSLAQQVVFDGREQLKSIHILVHDLWLDLQLGGQATTPPTRRWRVEFELQKTF